jgi:hypothetical protein
MATVDGSGEAGELEGRAAIVAAFEALKGPGVEVVRAVHADADLLLVVASLDALEPMLRAVDAERERGVTVRGALADPAVRVVVGSGFVSQLDSLMPVGLLQVEGRVESAVQPHGYRRIVGLTPDRIGVVGHRDRHPGLFDSALQAGPGVVEAGLLDITERDLERPRWVRAIVGTCGERVVVGMTLAPAHLFSVGRALLEAVPGCDEVVNLAGDREAVLALSDGRRSVWLGRPETAKVALVALVQRPALAR